jgi:hypothetical protein
MVWRCDVTDKTNYPANAVAMKLYNLVESPAELILGQALFALLSTLYERWSCWVYSNTEFDALRRDGKASAKGEMLIALVPQCRTDGVGRLDFGIFIPALSKEKPIVAVECDGHDFHERTREQASSDRERDRALSKLAIPLMRFTGTDVVRKSTEVAQEIVEFFDERANIAETEWFRGVGITQKKIGRKSAMNVRASTHLMSGRVLNEWITNGKQRDINL